MQNVMGRPYLSNAEESGLAKQSFIRGLRSVPLNDEQRKLLVQRRNELELTQQQLADEVGCLQLSIHNIETGKHQPAPGMLQKLCAALDLEYDVSVYVYLRPRQ
jgi:DNA-binding XRE family transcriptional regulator